MITIRVMMHNDKLIGYDCSSRWNLLTLIKSVSFDPNNLKALRAALKEHGFKLLVIKRVRPAWTATPLERAALGETAPIAKLAVA